MHLSSADLCARLGDCPDCECLKSDQPPAVLAADAIKALDDAHVSKGVILSGAYLYARPSVHLSAGETAKKVRLENEFTAAEVAKYPKRLVGFFSVNPLQDSAVEEVRYWGAKSQFAGLKLHFNASAVNVRNAEDRKKVSRILAEAAKKGLPMVIHVGGGNFNASDAELFITEILPSAGDSWVQIAHAGGGMPSRNGNNLAVLRTFGDHIVRNDPRTRRILFDLSFVPAPDDSPQGFAQEIRRIGFKHFVFGSDFSVQMPSDAIVNLKRLGLSAEEMQTLSQNCAPWAC
ncbi:amidohydrolase family protein [Candidatus Korobacter versatilis]|nr:amidohydrolase family protein [Candidatus Koribacter versatilis]